MRLRFAMFSALLLSLPREGSAQATADSTRRSSGAPAETSPPATPGSGRSAVDDLITATRNALNDLKYGEAIDLAKEALIQKRLRRSQSVLINQLIGAAYFPDPDESSATANSDSATVYLRRAIRLQPDAMLPEDIRWKGLDSLYQRVRGDTFAAIAEPSREYALTGVDGRAFIEVISAKPSHMWLRSLNRRDGSLVVHDSVRGATRARLALRAHDGERALFVAGEYEVQIVVSDATGRASDTLRFSAIAFGAPPVLEPIPAFPAYALRPERARRAILSGIGAGLFVGGMSVALSRYARHDNAIQTSVNPDSRATVVGALTLVGGIVGGIIDRGKPLPANVRANADLRATHAQSVAAIQSANRKKVGDYKVELRIDGETAR